MRAILYPKTKRIRNISLCIVFFGYILPRWALYLYWRKKFIQAFPELDGTSWIFGNILKDVNGLDRLFRSLRENVGSISSLWISGPFRPEIAICDPAYSFEVFSHASSRPIHVLDKSFVRLLGFEQYFNSSKAQEARLHLVRILNSTKLLVRMNKSVADCVLLETKNWSLGCVNFAKEFEVFLFDIFGKVFFGEKFWSDRIRKLYFKVVRNSRMWALYTIPPVWNSQYREYLSCCEELRGWIAYVVGELSLLDDDDPNVIGSLLLAAKQRPLNEVSLFSKEEVCAHLFGLFHFSILPTLYGLYWTLYHLAENPKAQQSVQDETDAKIGKVLPPSLQELENLPILNASLQEALRLHPPYPVIQRQLCGKESSIELGGKIIPEGCTINLVEYLSFLDESYFPNSQEFQPKRYLENNNNKYTPSLFGHGLRSCVGERLSKVVIKTVLAMLLQRYTISLDKVRPITTFACHDHAGISYHSNAVHFFYFHDRDREDETQYVIFQ